MNLLSLFFLGAGLGTLANEIVSFLKFMYKKYYDASETKEVLEGLIPLLDDLHNEEDSSHNNFTRVPLPLFLGAGLGTLANEIVSLLKCMHKKYYAASEMKDVLEGLIPILDEIHNEENTSASAKKIEEFRKKLKDAQQEITRRPPGGLEAAKGLSSLEDYVKNFSEKFGWPLVPAEMHQISKEMRVRERENRERGSPSLQTQQPPSYQVGLTARVRELKECLLKENAKKVGVIAMGGSGKTTLVAALCEDSEVKGRFENIIFETVSQNPTSIKEILESIWKKIKKSEAAKTFRDVTNARCEIQDLLKSQSQSTLVVLDDVWTEADLKELLFEAPKYKTLVTTRINFAAHFDSCYNLPLLEKNDALSLLCVSAFGIDHIPETGCRKILVEEVAEECRQLPLALKVVGAYLYGKPERVWKHVKKQLSDAQPISTEHQDGLLERLAISVSALKEDEQLCFFDLGLFPEDSKIAVDSLFDIWIHHRNLKWIDAFLILLELVKQNLLVLLNDPRNHPGTSHDSVCELYVVQHDVLRDLAIYLAHKKGKTHEMLIMPRNEDPMSWEEQSEAEIISIHSGSMNKEQWPEMKFPKARVLVLSFTGNEYFLPPFLKTMAELEVLLIIKQDSGSTKLEDMLAFVTSLTHLKSIRLQRLTVPSHESHGQSLKNLKVKKLSLSLCEGDDGSNHGLDIGVCSMFPGVEEINLDRCKDLKELPASICRSSRLQKLSITNCRKLEKLPENLGDLAGSLVMLMLGSCSNLKALPDSICKLGRLQFLDISHCGCIKTLPNEFGSLQSLDTLDIRYASSKLEKLPASATRLQSLSRVISDSGKKKLRANFKVFFPNLHVEIAERNKSIWQ